MNRRLLLRGLAGVALLTLLPGGSRLGRSFGRGSSRGGLRGATKGRSRGALYNQIYRSSPFGTYDPVRAREGEQQREAARQQRLMNIQDRRAAIARDRAIERESRGLVTDRHPPAPTNRLSDRLRPEVEPLGSVGTGAARKSGNRLPPTIGPGQSPEFLARHSAGSYKK